MPNPSTTLTPAGPKNELDSILNRLSHCRGWSEEEVRAREMAAEKAEASARGVELLRAAQVPERAKEFTRRPEYQPPAGSAPLFARLGTGLIAAVVGNRGTGKTCLAAALVRASARRGASVRYAKAMDIFLTVRASFRADSKTSELTALAAFIQPQLLVIDEMQERGETKWEDRLLNYVIDKRYDAQRDTILIANLTELQLATQLGASIASRIDEAGGVIECAGESFRGRAASRDGDQRKKTL